MNSTDTVLNTAAIKIEFATSQIIVHRFKLQFERMQVREGAEPVSMVRPLNRPQLDHESLAGEQFRFEHSRLRVDHAT